MPEKDVFPRLAALLTLLAGLAFGAQVLAQDTPSGAVVKDAVGTLTVQIGSNPPQPYKPGTAVPVGAILRTGANSSVTLVFPDGQICALGPNTTFRMAAYAYDPRDAAKNQIQLNLISGSLRVIMGEIARTNPGAVQVQVGVATLGVNAASAPRTDASVVVQGGPVAITVERGSVTTFLPSGQPQPIQAGQGLLLAANGNVTRGTTAQVMQQLATQPQGLQMQQQFAGLQAMSKNLADLVLTLSTPSAAQELLAQLDNLPPPGQVQSDPPPPVFNASGTPGTSASSGGTPCSASCN
jgi:hypothetical protein